MLQLVGYFAKSTALPEGWRTPEHVKEICSVSNCITGAPAGWINRRLHNDFGFFNTRADARAVVPDQHESFSLFAYRLADHRFVEGRPEPIIVAPSSVEPLPRNFDSLGFDAVSRSTSSFFECSPLSCNGMAAEVPVNCFCLVETEAEAMALGQRFSREEQEPGPYYVIEVLRALPDRPR